MARLVERDYRDYLIDLGDTVRFEHEGETLEGECVRVYFGSGALHVLVDGQRYLVEAWEANKVFDD